MQVYDGKKTIKENLKSSGSFRSPECIELLKQADIVVTNPPFSKFRMFVELLMKYKKKFLILGNMNSVTHQQIFPFIQGNKMWLGYTPRGHTFYRPDGTTNQVNSVWYTNLRHSKRDEKFIATSKYTPEEYPTYDNYNAIEVGKVANIPENYKGIMGVPRTFLDKYNPKQFEIIGADWQMPKTKPVNNKTDVFYLNGHRKFARIAIKWKENIK